MPSALALGYAATAVSLYATVPQVLRAVRTRSVEGLSWLSLVLGLVTCALWGSYGAAIGDPVQILNNGAALLLLGALAAVAVRVTDGLRLAPALALVALTLLVALLVAFTGHAFAVAMVGTAVGAVRAVPQVLLAVRRAPLWGLDPWAVLLGVVAPLLWLAYGAAERDLAVMISSVLAVAMNGVVLGFRLPPRRTLSSLAGGRLGPVVARPLRPVAARYPYAAQYTEAA